VNLEFKKGILWCKKIANFQGKHFWVTAKPEIFYDKLVLQKPIKTLQQILEFDNNFYKFVRRRQLLTFSML
jgi:hypothetical protein